MHGGRQTHDAAADDDRVERAAGCQFGLEDQGRLGLPPDRIGKGCEQEVTYAPRAS